MNKIIFLFSVFCFFFISSCYFSGRGALSSRVRVAVNARSQYGDRISTYPVLYLSNGSSDKICRQHPFKVKDVREVLKRERVSDDYIAELVGEEVSASSGDSEEGGGESSSSDRLEPSKTAVSGNYISFGLEFDNYNPPGYFLLIESISYSAVARYRGQTIQLAPGTIDSSYCDGQTSYLYFIAGGRGISYRPSRNNPFENLTIFLDGFEVIDKTGLPPCSLNSVLNNQGASPSSLHNQGGAGTTGTGATAGATATTGAGASAGATAGASCYNPNEKLIEIPKYDVTLFVRGYFTTQSGGDPIHGFVKRLHFSTQSQPF